MKSNKKHHGHTNNDWKQNNKNNNQVKTNQSNQPNVTENKNNNEQKESIKDWVNSQLDLLSLKNKNNKANEVTDLENKEVTSDENLPVVSKDQSVADAINEQNDELIHQTLEPTDDLTLQNKNNESKYVKSGPINSPAEIQPKKLGIIIVEHNAQISIKDLIISLQNLQDFSDTDVNIYIWDDYSTDYSRAYIAGLSKHFQVHYIFNDDLQGTLCARNNMLKYVNDDYIIFIDKKDTLAKDALKFFFNNCKDHDFLMLKRNIMYSMSKQMVDAAAYSDKGSKIDTYLVKTPYSFVTGIFVKKTIYQKVRDLIAKNTEYVKDIRFYEDMVTYTFWVYYCQSPCILNSYYHYNLMTHDEYLLTDTCQEEQHHDSLKAIYAIDKIGKDALLNDLEFKAIKYTMDVRLIHTYWSTANRKKKENVNVKVQELLDEFIKPIPENEIPQLLAKDKAKLRLVSSIHFQRFFHLFHK